MDGIQRISFRYIHAVYYEKDATLYSVKCGGAGLRWLGAPWNRGCKTYDLILGAGCFSHISSLRRQSVSKMSCKTCTWSGTNLREQSVACTGRDASTSPTVPLLLEVVPVKEHQIHYRKTVTPP